MGQLQAGGPRRRIIRQQHPDRRPSRRSRSIATCGGATSASRPRASALGSGETPGYQGRNADRDCRCGDTAQRIQEGRHKPGILRSEPGDENGADGGNHATAAAIRRSCARRESRRKLSFACAAVTHCSKFLRLTSRRNSVRPIASIIKVAWCGRKVTSKTVCVAASQTSLRSARRWLRTVMPARPGMIAAAMTGSSAGIAIVDDEGAPQQSGCRLAAATLSSRAARPARLRRQRCAADCPTSSTGRSGAWRAASAIVARHISPAPNISWEQLPPVAPKPHRCWRAAAASPCAMGIPRRLRCRKPVQRGRMLPSNRSWLQEASLERTHDRPAPLRLSRRRRHKCPYRHRNPNRRGPGTHRRLRRRTGSIPLALESIQALKQRAFASQRQRGCDPRLQHLRVA